MLSKVELDVLSHHFKETTQNLPGTLPAKAILHKRQLSLFWLGSLLKHPANDGICELCDEKEEDIYHVL